MKNQQRKKLGAIIRGIREELGLTQKAFAEPLGIVQGYLSDIEHGVKAPTETFISAFLYRYPVDEKWLHTLKGWKYIPGTSHEAEELLMKFIEQKVLKVTILTYEDHLFGRPNGFLIETTRGIISIRGNTTRSDYSGGGPNAYRWVLEELLKKGIKTGRVEIDQATSESLDDLDLSTFISQADFSDNVIKKELHNLRPDIYPSEDDLYNVVETSTPNIVNYDLIPAYDTKSKGETDVYLDTIAFNKKWINTELHSNSQNLSILPVSGDSMRPAINSGDMILIDKKCSSFELEGIYILIMGETVLLKRLQRLPGDQIRISSDNPSYEPFDINTDQIGKEIEIVGRVIWVGKKV